MSKLTNNTATMESILRQINALPDAGGNATYKTCTINIQANENESNTSIFFHYMTVENGKIIVKKVIVASGSSISVSCLCDSMVTIECSGWQFSYNGAL